MFSQNYPQKFARRVAKVLRKFQVPRKKPYRYDAENSFGHGLLPVKPQPLSDRPNANSLETVQDWKHVMPEMLQN